MDPRKVGILTCGVSIEFTRSQGGNRIVLQNARQRTDLAEAKRYSSIQRPRPGPQWTRSVLNHTSALRMKGEKKKRKKKAESSETNHPDLSLSVASCG